MFALLRETISWPKSASKAKIEPLQDNYQKMINQLQRSDPKMINQLQRSDPKRCR